MLNVVHGDKEAVDAILSHPDIKAVSFVGSSDIAQYVYSNGTAHGKRVQAMGGAKNHGIILPDADMDQVVKDLVGAAYGSAGERCMALPVVVPVGKRDRRRIARTAVAGNREAEGRHLHRCRRAIRPGRQRRAQAEDRRLYRDRREERAPSWCAMAAASSCKATKKASSSARRLFDNVKTDMTHLPGRNLRPGAADRARRNASKRRVALPSQHQYGNGVAIFTRNGRAAREFAARVNVGMVGINVPIPVPVAYHTFGGWKRCAFGDTNQHGMEGVRFCTKVKTVTARWPEGDVGRSSFVIPTMR